MNKPAFNPNQPFEASKPAFDPNVPFTPGEQTQQMGGSPPLGFVAKQVLSATPMAHPIKNLPVLGATVGGPIGAGVGAIASRMGDIASGSPVGTPLQEATGPMAQAALAGLPEATEVKNVIQNTAQNLGRRALGVTKGMLGRLKGGIPQANQAAQEMLDQGVIRPFSGAKATLVRAEDVAATSGAAVGKALASTGQHALDTNEVSQKVIEQLAPEFQGGAYDAKEKIANEIVDTIGAHGNGPIDFESAQRLKNTLKEMAGSNWNTDKVKASMYQRAYGIVSDALEQSVADSSSKLPVVNQLSKTGSPTALFDYNDSITGKSSYQIQGNHGYGATPNVPYDTLQTKGIPVVGQTSKAAKLGHIPLDSIPSSVSGDYLRNKKIYGASQTVIKSLEDKANAEASNSLLSLRGAVIGGGALATGNIGHALEALGTWEAARRVGTATGASLLNSAKSVGMQAGRRAAMAAFIDKVTTK